MLRSSVPEAYCWSYAGFYRNYLIHEKNTSKLSKLSKEKVTNEINSIHSKKGKSMPIHMGESEHACTHTRAHIEAIHLHCLNCTLKKPLRLWVSHWIGHGRKGVSCILWTKLLIIDTLLTSKYKWCGPSQKNASGWIAK